MPNNAENVEAPDYVNYSGKGIGEYTQEEAWENYVERLESHMRGCNIKNEDQKRDILVSTVGRDTYVLMKNLLGREKPQDKSFKDLHELVRKHKNPTPPWQSERLKFLNRDCKPGETVMDFVAALRKLMSTCKYPEAEYSNQLRDRLLHGCADPKMQKSIIEVGEELTFETAVKAALQFEAQQKFLREMSGKDKLTDNVHQIHDRCSRCNGKHSVEKCKFRNTICHGFSKRGHLVSCCPNRRSNRGCGSHTKNNT